MLRDVKLPYHLVPPDNHRRNLSKRGMQACKNHLMFGISSAHPYFPLMLWDIFVKRANTTINLLRNSRINSKLSARAQLFGTFNYDTNPLDTPGCKCIVDENPNVRGTWSVHSLNACYTGPAMQHYRCCEVHVTKTSSKLVLEVVTYIPHDITMPPVVSRKSALTIIKDLINLLNNDSKHLLFQEHYDSSLVALQQLSNIFTPESTLASIV